MMYFITRITKKKFLYVYEYNFSSFFYKGRSLSHVFEVKELV